MRALGRGILHVAVASAAALWSQAALAADQPTYAPTEAWVKPVPIPQGGAVADGAPAQVLLYEVQAKFGDQGDEYFVDRVSKILTPEGLPIGLQIIGRRHADASVLSVAAAVESMRPWVESYPGLRDA